LAPGLAKLFELAAQPIGPCQLTVQGGLLGFQNQVI
jgi:hypothetical protein